MREDRVGQGIVLRTYIDTEVLVEPFRCFAVWMLTGDILGLDELFDQTRFESVAVKHGGRADLTAVLHSVFFLKGWLRAGREPNRLPRNGGN